MILLIDNYDSFTYNVFQLIANLGKEVKVVRNDCITIEEIDQGNYGAIIISLDRTLMNRVFAKKSKDMSAKYRFLVFV